jgi:hypothetical protein
MTHVLAIAFGLLVGTLVCWLAARRFPRPSESPDLDEVIRHARDRCNERGAP